MIVSSRFVYLHIPKTGGTFVERVLGRLVEKRLEIYLDTSTHEGRSVLGGTHHHETIADVPAEFRTNPLIISARNPYDHYVSHFEFMWWRKEKDSLFNDDTIRKKFPVYPDLEFSDFVRSLNDWTLRPRMSRNDAQDLNHAQIGFLTWEYLRFIFEYPYEVVRELIKTDQCQAFQDKLRDAKILFMESLNMDVYNLVTSLGCPVLEAKSILELDRIYPPEGGRSSSSNWKEYFSEDLITFVRERERLLFSSFPQYDHDQSRLRGE